MTTLQRWDDVADEVAGPTVREKTIPGVGATLVHIAIAAGAKAPRHGHPFEQFVHVVSGSGRLETIDGVTPFCAGAVFHFPPNT